MKKFIIIFAVVFTILNITISFGGVFLNKENVNEEITKNGTFKNTLSMMLENETGDYIATTAEEWPSAGYKFNSKLSKCESGGKVSWDYANKRVKMTGASSDKCYIYFDKIVTVDSYCEDGNNLADCIKTYGNTGYDKSSIYIHDSSLTNGAGDNSYRFAGASDYVNNFVCFGTDASTCPIDNLYRIIGVFGDQVKLIKYDYATSALLGTDGAYGSPLSDTSKYYKGNNLSNVVEYYWSSSDSASNSWSESMLNVANLNVNFINNIGAVWSNMIATTTWKVGGNTWANIAGSPMYTAYQNEIVSPAESTTYSAKIGLMYVSDYGYAASPTYWTFIGYDVNGSWNSDHSAWVGNDYGYVTDENWMYMGLYEWTITRESNEIVKAYRIFSSGNVHDGTVDYRKNPLRPAFYLKSSIKYVSGKGTKESPIRLENSEVTLADYVKSKYTGSQGANGIYLHNSSLTNGAGDNSYRYAGSNPNNYVCFGTYASTCPTDNLYRIIGVFGDQVKLVKFDFATDDLLGTDGAYHSSFTMSTSQCKSYKGSLSTVRGYYYSSNGGGNTWSTSSLNKTNLNKNFINNIGSTWADKIAETSWKVGGGSESNIEQAAMNLVYQNEIVSPAQSDTYNAKIGLMYVSDYGYAVNNSYWTYTANTYYNVKSDNWMDMCIRDFSISKNTSYSGYIFYASDGHIDSGYNDNYPSGVRPTFYLTSDVAITGEHTGSASDPIRLAI